MIGLAWVLCPAQVDGQLDLLPHEAGKHASTHKQQLPCLHHPPGSVTLGK